MSRSIPSIDFRLATSDDPEKRQQFVDEVGDALKDIGFFALTNHGIPRSL
ncbi:MAG TPA: isopenicillin N synthase family oxygenase, partial [Candidatus Poseidoniales archaeon]